jgi:nucleoside 2-deoxyribosyltransferase
MIKKHLWTSILEYPESLDNLMGEFIESIKDKIEFFPTSKVTLIKDEDLKDDPAFHWRSDVIIDHTCIAKGWFIRRFIIFVQERLGELPEDFIVNFGGDIYSCTQSEETVVNSKYHSNLKFLIRKGGNVFCSTNREREGHIPDALYDVSYSFNQVDPLLSDKYATLGLVGKNEEYSLVFNDKYIANETYIASPFFCSTDIEIRDRMVLGFINYIRPDLLNPNIEGDLHKDKVLAQKIKDDNLSAIDKCSVLVFPKDTTDLGTLFEVGYAIRKGKMILRYDYTQDIYEVIVNPIIPNILSDSYILDLNKLGSGIVLGYHYDKPLKYFLGSSRDNIMLMNNILVDKPTELYPCYLPQILSDSVYRLNTLTSGS